MGIEDRMGIIDPRTRVRRFCVMLSLLVGCNDLPRDPEETLQRVTSGTLRVGVVHNPPWIATDGSEPAGIDAAMVRELAAALNAEIEWHSANEGELMRSLEEFELDIVVCGLTEDTPWKDRVGITGPYDQIDRGSEAEDRHVAAVPPGENAWLLYLDRWIERRKSEPSAIISGVRP